LYAFATYVGRFVGETAAACTFPAKLLHVITLLDALDVMLEVREPSSHTFSPVMLRGIAGGGPDVAAGGVIPLITTALVVGDDNAPTWDARTTAPSAAGAFIMPPPDLETFPPPPDGTY
jgi:hypothetical protein